MKLRYCSTRARCLRQSLAFISHGCGSGLLLISCLLFAHCGGQTSSQGAEGGTTGGNAGSFTLGGRLEGGASAQAGGAAGTLVILPGGSAGFANGAGGASATGGDGAAGDAGECDGVKLWEAVVEGAVGGLGRCDPSPVPGENEKLSNVRGAVIIGADGAIIDNTGLSGAERIAWLAKWGSERWPCYANQSFGYKCKAAS